MRRASHRLFMVAAALAVVSFAGAMYLTKVRRDFSGPLTITVGKVVRNSAPSTRAGRRHSELFCWVSYEFTPPDGVTRRNWRFWRHGCGVSPGRPIPIQHPVADPDVNRPAESEPMFPAGLFFFATGVTVVIAFLVRRSEEERSGHSVRGIDL